MIAHDKKLHFIAGAVICLVVGLAVIPVAGFIVAAIVGMAKELYDTAHPKTHTADPIDFVATALGGAIVALVLIFIERL